MAGTTILEFENTRVIKFASGEDRFGCTTYTLIIDGITYTDVSSSAEWQRYWMIKKTGENTYSVKMTNNIEKDLEDYLPFSPNCEIIENIAQFVKVKFNYTTKDCVIARKCDYYTEEKKARIKEYDTKRKELIDRTFADGTFKELGQKLAELDKEYEDCVFGTK